MARLDPGVQALPLGIPPPGGVSMAGAGGGRGAGGTPHPSVDAARSGASWTQATASAVGGDKKDALTERTAPALRAARERGAGPLHWEGG